MIDLTGFAIILILAGGISLAFAALAIMADVVIPALARHTWRGRRAARHILK